MNNSRKREKPYLSRHAPYSLPKRRRPLPLDAAAGSEDVSTDADNTKSKALTSVLVIGVPSECSILDIKSRFEMYGPISRTRMEPNGVAYISFRSSDSAAEAVKAARDLSFPITLLSVPVQVMWANDPIPQWKKSGEVKTNEGLSSKLVRAQVPLRRHGRANRLGSAIVNPRADENNNNSSSNNGDDEGNSDIKVVAGNSSSDGLFKGREIVAYDDIL